MKSTSKTLVALIVISQVCLIASAFASGISRSMWVWEYTTRTMLNDTSQQEQLLDFAASKNIGTLYLYADTFDGSNDITDNPELYQSFIAESHSKGIEVHALLGSSGLSTWEYCLPENHYKAEEMITNLLNYNNISSTAQQFDGVNVDIEPYLLSDWWSQQPTYSENYLDMLLIQKELINDSGQDLLFGPVIPRWYDVEDSLILTWDGENKNLLYHIIDLSDYITVMDYKTLADIIIADAQAELIYAQSTDKKVVVGVETAPTPATPLSSFYGSTEEEMEAQLAIVENVLETTYSSYDGIALHHYTSYYEMTIPEPSSIILILFGIIGLYHRRTISK